MIRTSDYIIYVPLKYPNEVMLIHGYTGAFYRASVKEVEMLQAISSAEGYIPRKTGVPLDVLKRFTRLGFINNRTREQEQVFFAKIVANMHKKKMRSQLMYTIVPTYECNFFCTYCSQTEMRKTRGMEYVNKKMSPSLVHHILRAMDAIEKRQNTDHNTEEQKRRQICLYGGEPFLAKNREIVEYIISHARDVCEPSFSAISNGSELEHYKDLLSPEIINNIQITLDGALDVHNRRRRHLQPETENYSKILQNINMALDKGVDIHVRVNVDSKNVDYLPQLGEEIEKQGWNKHKHFSIAAASVYVAPKEKCGKTEYFSLGQLNEHLKTMLHENNQKNWLDVSESNIFGKMEELFVSGKYLTPLYKYNYCSAPTSMYTFTPHGEVYTCLDMVGIAGEEVANIDESGNISFYEDQLAKWQKRNVLASEECRQCSYSLFCGGGCATKAEEKHGTMYAPFCDDFKDHFNAHVAQMPAVLENKCGTLNNLKQGVACGKC